MSDPVDPPRLASGAGEHSELAALFRAGELDVARDAELAQLERRLGSVLSAPQPPPGPAPSPLRAWRWVGVAGGVIGAAALGVALTRHRPEPAPSVSAPPKVISAPAPSAPPATPAPAVTAAPALSASEAPRPAENPAPPQLKRRHKAEPSEAALLEQARRALATDPEKALALTRQHQQRYPNGVLRQEREVIAISALRRLGRAPEASQRATSFEQQFPDSAHRRSVEKGPAK